MIKQYKLRIAVSSGKRLQFNTAYNLYGALMEQIDKNYGSILHSQECCSINQNVIPLKNVNEAIWTINLLDDTSIEVFSKILENNKKLYLSSTESVLEVLSTEQNIIPDDKSLIYCAKNIYNTDVYNFSFSTPTSFKSSNEYMIFPSVAHIVNSLVNKWNSYSREYSIDDPDALEMMLTGLRISDYKLRSSRFIFKGNKIPGFIGEVTITSKLSYSLNYVWGILACFANYSGIGIKTTLGMGSVITK